MAEQELTPVDALSTLDKAVATIKTDRNGHIILQNGITVLQKALDELKSLKASSSSTAEI